MGILGTGVGFIIMVRSLYILGPTVSATFSNFCLLQQHYLDGCLDEILSPMQLLGGSIVIAAGYIVIREKGRVEENTNGGTD